MRRPVESLQRALRGPAGGMLLCLLLAAALGGVAAANPGGGLFATAGKDVAGEQDPSAARTTLGTDAAPGTHDGDGRQQGGDAGQGADGEHVNGGQGADAANPQSKAECAATIEHVQDELALSDNARGLSNAIVRVNDNCSGIGQASGLIEAMEHLTANLERQLAHELGRSDDPGDAGQEPGGSSGAGGSAGEGEPPDTAHSGDAGQPTEAVQPAGGGQPAHPGSS
jgi:hypothetical protein